jgi:hypothetical protein
MNALRSILCAATLVASAAPARAADADAARESLREAAAYLWAQQGDDGGWHSPQYGLLASGQALTPYVLYALIDVPESIAPRPDRGVERALEFIRRHVDKSGAMGRSDPDVLEYPVYSTAYALLCLKRVQAERAERRLEDDQLIHRMERFLAAAQFDEEEGFKPTHPAYGGWGFDRAPAPGVAGHMDLAHTRRALAALAAGRPGGEPGASFDRDETLARALKFLAVVQKHPDAAASHPWPEDAPPTDADRERPPFDGGFYFSPVVLAANKGRFDGHWRSYATATCDGVLALLAAGQPRDGQRVAAAVAWLEAHGEVDYPSGVPKDHPEPWGEAIRFYHFAARAEALRQLGAPAEKRLALAAAVAALQRADGSFVNDASPLMKEDDPTLATALAVTALANALAEPIEADENLFDD